MTKSTECRLCGELIHFDKDITSDKTGKMIPLQDDYGYEYHYCKEWKRQNRRYYPCRDCGSKIYFDDAMKSKSGKFIPLDAETPEFTPHQCNFGLGDKSEE